MKTISLLSIGLLVLNSVLFAQPTSFQIGLNAVPFFDKTVELNATWTKSPGYDFFVHGGYTLPSHYPQNNNEFLWRYWEGTVSGAYLRVGGRAYLNKTGRFRPFFGAHLTNSYLNQSGEDVSILECIVAPCYPIKSKAAKESFLLSAGISGGVRVDIMPRLTLDLGVLANRFIFEKPELYNQAVYIPGYGRKPIQGVASVQYTLKGR
ncbi:hypothetical protein GCM10028803_36390 [Larkinella knui]|uniref:DUF3575 domain-containing protein n=1 Tax=Larkinella knui TaxID=2025310 RepID=A0A3P1CDW5_9BACT|nr:hypothetical protein [Larkinella knui]RRB11499.1 hypothetical protein EHT87_23775 [Larkinella knui]